METFSLLKYWRGGGATLAAAAVSYRGSSTASEATQHPKPIPEDHGASDEDEGPFFDLEFTAITDDTEAEHESSDSEEKEFNFDVTADGNLGNGNGELQSEAFSPSEDLFFKGKLVPSESEPEAKAPQFPASFLKSATKFRVLMLRLGKAKTTPGAKTEAVSPKENQNKLFVKFKVEEVMQIASLFTRDNSSRGSGAFKGVSKPPADDSAAASLPLPECEDKNNTKEIIQKYINKIKPLYDRVSKKNQCERATEEDDDCDGDVKLGEPGKLAASGVKGLNVVRKKLGKSRSGPVAVESGTMVVAATAQRRDDSLLQQQDGIQSAIAHCKRSFTATNKGEDGEDGEPCLPRSKSCV